MGIDYLITLDLKRIANTKFDNHVYFLFPNAAYTKSIVVINSNHKLWFRHF